MTRLEKFPAGSAKKVKIRVVHQSVETTFPEYEVNSTQVVLRLFSPKSKKNHTFFVLTSLIFVL